MHFVRSKVSVEHIELCSKPERRTDSHNVSYFFVKAPSFETRKVGPPTGVRKTGSALSAPGQAGVG